MRGLLIAVAMLVMMACHRPTEGMARPRAWLFGVPSVSGCGPNGCPVPQAKPQASTSVPQAAKPTPNAPQAAQTPQATPYAARRGVWQPLRALRQRLQSGCGPIRRLLGKC